MRPFASHGVPAATAVVHSIVCCSGATGLAPRHCTNRSGGMSLQRKAGILSHCPDVPWGWPILPPASSYPGTRVWRLHRHRRCSRVLVLGIPDSGLPSGTSWASSWWSPSRPNPKPPPSPQSLADGKESDMVPAVQAVCARTPKAPDAGTPKVWPVVVGRRVPPPRPVQVAVSPVLAVVRHAAPVWVAPRVHLLWAVLRCDLPGSPSLLTCGADGVSSSDS